MNDAEVVHIVRDQLHVRFDIKRIILFGSRATGLAKPDREYEVLLIVDTEIPFVRRQGLALLDLGERDFAIDLLIYTPAEADDAAAILGSTVYWALREGTEYPVH